MAPRPASPATISGQFRDDSGKPRGSVADEQRHRTPTPDPVHPHGRQQSLPHHKMQLNSRMVEQQGIEYVVEYYHGGNDTRQSRSNPECGSTPRMLEPGRQNEHMMQEEGMIGPRGLNPFRMQANIRNGPCPTFIATRARAFRHQLMTPNCPEPLLGILGPHPRFQPRPRTPIPTGSTKVSYWTRPGRHVHQQWNASLWL